MNWDAITAVGTLLGSLIVMISLVYLAVQVRQANRHAAASSEAAWMEGWNSALAAWVEDEATMAALRAGLESFDDLPKPQQAIFHIRVGNLANQWVLAGLLRDKGLIAEGFYEACTEFLVSVLSTPGGRQYWARDADATPNGRKLLELIDSGEQALPPITENMPWWAVDGD